MEYPCKECENKELFNGICIKEIDCLKFNSYIDELIEKGINKNIGGKSFVSCELCLGKLTRVKETKLIETYYLEVREGGRFFVDPTNKIDFKTSISFITKCRECGHINTDLMRKNIPILEIE